MTKKKLPNRKQSPKQIVKKALTEIRKQVLLLEKEKDSLRYMLDDFEQICDDYDYAVDDINSGIYQLQLAVEKMSERN